MYISQGLVIVWLTTWPCVIVTVWQMCGGKPHASKIWACDKNIGKKIQNVGTEERGFKEQIRWFTSCPETTWEILRVRIKTLNWFNLRFVKNFM